MPFVWASIGFLIAMFLFSLLCAASDADDDQERFEQDVDWEGLGDQASRLRELSARAGRN